MEKKTNIDLAYYRLERAKQDLSDAELLYKNDRLLTANNRAYYSIFHALKAVLALERVDFKKHKDVIAHFNHYYVKTEKFPKIISKKIALASKIREDSDYDDEFLGSNEDTFNQIETARYLIELVEEYLKNAK